MIGIILFIFNLHCSCFSGSDDMTDANVNKLIIVTQTPSPSSRNVDRLGNFNQKHSDVKLNDEIEHGLRRYEEELWSIEGKNVI